VHGRVIRHLKGPGNRVFFWLKFHHLLQIAAYFSGISD
jgi:hypothetical protein